VLFGRKKPWLSGQCTMRFNASLANSILRSLGTRIKTASLSPAELKYNARM
jgi:hypothetical protein